MNYSYLLENKITLMETWMIFAFSAMIFAGLNDFLMKVIASEGYNRDFIFFVRYIVGAFLTAILYILTSGDFTGIIVVVGGMLVLAFIKALFTYLIGSLKVKSLENIDSTLFFPLFKTFTSIFVIIVSVFILHENLNNKETFAIIISFMIPLFLINKAENLKQINMKKGLLYVLVISISACFSTFLSKYVNILELNIELFSFIVFVFGGLISYTKYLNKKNHTKYTNKPQFQMLGISILMGIFFSGAIYSTFKALEGNMVIVHTVRGFSLLIPIILSVIFYKEEMTYKKAFVIFLSIVSVILFI